MSVHLVVGGAGFIGSALTRQLAERAPVTVLDDLSSGTAENVEGVANVTLKVGSILDRDLVESVMDGVETVFHLACKGVRHSLHSPVANHEVNASGTLYLLEAARAAGVGRFVYVSSSEVYGTAVRSPMDEDHPTWPHTVYGGSKLAGEAYARAYHRTYGLATVVVRPFNSYGPRSHHEGDSGEVIPRFLVRAMNGLPPVVFGDGSQTRDFTFVEDTARGIALAAESEAAVGETINLGSGNETRIDDLARLVLAVTGRTELGIAHDQPRPGDVMRLIADSSRAADRLGWKPTTDLTTGLDALLGWHRRQGTDWGEALRQDVIRNWERG